MATFNGAGFVREQLESFAAQQRLPDELVVCDDQSEDDTLKIVEEFSLTSSFAVHIHRNPARLGYTANFSRAASLCTGDLISFSDQDDFWLPNKLSTVIREIEAKPDKQLFVNDEFIASAHLEPTRTTVFANVRKLGCFDRDIVAGCCTTVRRPLLDVLLPFPPAIAYDTWAAVMAEVLEVKSLIEQPLQLYRRHEANTTESLLALSSVTQWTVFRKFGLADPRAAWDDELQQLEVFEDRITGSATGIKEFAGAGAFDRALMRLEEQREWLTTRRKLLDKSRLNRFASVMSLWRSGFYERQFGFRSAFKDAIRP